MSGGPFRGDRPVSYWAALAQVRARRGPASARRCLCGAVAVAWRYRGGDPHEQRDPATGTRYSLDAGRYLPECARCHRRVGELDGRQAVRLYNAGAPISGIATLLGASRFRVLRAVRAAGVPIRRPGRVPRGPSLSASPTPTPTDGESR